MVITHDHHLAAQLPRQIEMLDGRIVSDEVSTIGEGGLMRTRWRSMLVVCAVAASIAIGGLAVATSPRALAQSAPSGSTGADSCPSSNAPNELVLTGGTPQTAQLDTGFANPLQVELANTNGCPVTTAVAGRAGHLQRRRPAGRAPRSPRADRTR